MNHDLERVIGLVQSQKENINTIFLYGSYVNGYYKSDSDIDVVVVSEEQSEKPISYPPNISVHYVTSTAMSFFDTGRAYAHLRMLPILNEQGCRKISDKVKSELVRRELIRFKRRGITEIELLDPINNFLLGYAVERPWRIKPIKRMFNSKETQMILREEYDIIFGILEGRKMVDRIEKGRYRINENFMFDEGSSKATIKEGFGFKLRNSYGGWCYLTNVPAIINFSKRRI